MTSKGDPEKIRQQYEILHSRTWNYNELLWKNFVAYGAVLSSVAYLAMKEASGNNAAQAVIVAGGGGILWLLGIIQVNLLRGHRKSVTRLADFEGEQGYVQLTTRPTWDSLFGSYAIATWAMIIFAFFLLFVSLGYFTPWLRWTVFGVTVVIATYYLYQLMIPSAKAQLVECGIALANKSTKN